MRFSHLGSLLWRLILVCLSLMSSPSIADDLVSYTIKLENHLFFPSRLEVPANTKFKLIIENKDDVLEEFDSFQLNREKVLFPGRKVSLYIGPLSRGEYAFFGDYNRSTAAGLIIVLDKSTFYNKHKEIKNVD